MAGEEADGFRREAVAGSAAVVDLAHGEIDLQGADIGDDAREGDHGIEQLLGMFQVAGMPLVPLVDGLGVGFLMDDIAPDFKVSGDMGLAVGFPFETSEKDEEIRSLTEDSACGRGWRSVPRRSS